MALNGSSFSQGVGNNIGFPQSGGIANRETPQESKARIAKEEADQARLNDPYGSRPSEAGQTKRLVRVKKKQARVQNQQTSSSNGTAGTRRGRGPAGPQGGNSLTTFLNSKGSLNRASVQWESKQAQNPQNPTTNSANRFKMLGGMKSCLNLDYSMMKLNENDKSFAFKPAETRQLLAVVQSMIGGNSKEMGGNKKADGTEERPLSPQAFGRKKNVLRRLAAMSEPNPRLPDNLPADYKPFESVA